jgi:hypothetical protein
MVTNLRCKNNGRFELLVCNIVDGRTLLCVVSNFASGHRFGTMDCVPCLVDAHDIWYYFYI